MRLLLADDHALLLDGLRNVLAPEFDVVAAVGDGRAVVDTYQSLRPDLLLLDIGLPMLNGIEAARQVMAMDSHAKILFVTMRSERIYVQEAFRAGASGYVLKQSAARELVSAIRAVLEGQHYLSPMIQQENDLPFEFTRDPAGYFESKLTGRQREVLQLVAEGKSLKEIAYILKISVRTVEFHKHRIMEALGVRTTAELTRYAVDHYLVTPSEETPLIPG